MKIGINIHPTMSRELRVLRGGSFNSDTWVLRTTRRNRGEPERRFRYSGFRIVVSRGKQ